MKDIKEIYKDYSKDKEIDIIIESINDEKIIIITKNYEIMYNIIKTSFENNPNKKITKKSKKKEEDEEEEEFIDDENIYDSFNNEEEYEEEEEDDDDGEFVPKEKIKEKENNFGFKNIGNSCYINRLFILFKKKVK
jgi:hypothetical protein